jgi:hypothetical protein
MTTDPEAKRQADELTDKIDDIIHRYIWPHADGASGLAADEIVRQLPQLLHQAGWMPPQTLERVQDWATRTGALPEHHVNRSVLTSHLAELADILHGR